MLRLLRQLLLLLCTSALVTAVTYEAQLFQARFMQNATVGRGGYPRGVQLASGTRLVCVGMDVYSSELVAGDATAMGPWQKIGTVLTDSRPGVDLANCNLAQLPSGRVLASYRHHVPVLGDKGGPLRYAIEISYSDSGGRSWEEMLKIPGSSDVAHGPVSLWEPFLWLPTGAAAPVAAVATTGAGIAAVAGSEAAIWCAYSAEITNGGRQNIVWRQSVNGGLSWGSAQVVSYGPEHMSRDGMPGIARLGDGSLLVVFEGFWQWAAHNTTRHHFSVQGRRSFDNGRTWDSGRVIFTPASTAKGINAGAPQVLASPSTGEIFVSFMTDEDVGTAPGKWIANAQVKVMRGKLVGTELVFDIASRFLVSPAAPPSLWAGLAQFGNLSYVLFSHGGESHVVGPLEEGCQRTVRALLA